MRALGVVGLVVLCIIGFWPFVLAWLAWQGCKDNEVPPEPTKRKHRTVLVL